MCLSEAAGGPSVESWAWAADQAGLDVLVRHGVMNVHPGPMHNVVERGERGIARALQAEGLGFATLLSKYRKVSLSDLAQARPTSCVHARVYHEVADIAR